MLNYLHLKHNFNNYSIHILLGGESVFQINYDV